MTISRVSQLLAIVGNGQILPFTNEQNQHFADLRQKVCFYILKEVCQVSKAKKRTFCGNIIELRKHLKLCHAMPISYKEK